MYRGSENNDTFVTRRSHKKKTMNVKKIKPTPDIKLSITIILKVFLEITLAKPWKLHFAADVPGALIKIWNEKNGRKNAAAHPEIPTYLVIVMWPEKPILQSH